MTYFVLSGTWSHNSVKLHSMQCNGQASGRQVCCWASHGHKILIDSCGNAVGTVLQAPAVSSKCRVDKGGSADLDTISFFTFHCLVMAFFSGRGAHNFTVHRNCLNTLESGPDHYVIWVFHVTDAVIILYCFAHVVYVFVCCWTRSLLAVAGGSCLYIVLIIT